ncbi:MAG: Crp/Fnr family transcriptional regulator [Casimicrobiaceae bacterium]
MSQHLPHKATLSSTAAPARFAIERSKLSPRKQRDIFAALSPTERELFLERCKEDLFDAGSLLFSQNDRSTTTYFIRSGIVRAYYVSPTGKEITVAYWSAGTLVGAPNVFNEQGRHVWCAQAVTDVVTLGIRGRRLEDAAMKIPALAHYLIDTLAFKLHWMSVLLQTFGTESVRLRLAHLLLQLSEHYGLETSTKQGGGTMIQHHFSHEELARMVGATRTWVTLTLSTFKKEGMVACNGRHLVVLDKRKLEDVILTTK